MHCKALRLDHWMVKNAIENCDLLRGKKPIARGTFSAVYEGTRKNTVLKLTVDDVARGLLADGVLAQKHRHLPRLIRCHGTIGDAKINGKDYPLYLIEIERLFPLQRGTETARLARRLLNAERSACTNWHSGNPTFLKKSICNLEMEGIPRSLCNAIGKVAEFMNRYGERFARLDLHYGNLMQRKNGDLVIADPVCNWKIAGEAKAQLIFRGW